MLNTARKIKAFDNAPILPLWQMGADSGGGRGLERPFEGLIEAGRGCRRLVEGRFEVPYRGPDRLEGHGLGRKRRFAMGKYVCGIGKCYRNAEKDDNRMEVPAN
jgi:hypothetical protein